MKDTSLELKKKIPIVPSTGPFHTVGNEQNLVNELGNKKYLQ